MLQGKALRLHKNTFVRVNGEENVGLVSGFDADKQQWRVLMDRLERLVDEESVHVCFAVLPASSMKVAGYVKVTREDAQGTCGRGLIAAQDIQRGYPIVEEPPLIVCHNAGRTSSSFEHHSLRVRHAAAQTSKQHPFHPCLSLMILYAISSRGQWKAYKMLASKAKSLGPDTPWGKGCAAFESLVAHKPATASSKDAARMEAARQLAAQEAAAAGLDDERQRAFAEHVQDTLDRFAANETGFDNLADEESTSRPAWEVHGLYAFGSLFNHSCAPNVTVISKEAFCRLNGRPYHVEREGGNVVFLALRDIAAGERLTTSYVAGERREALSVTQRRELLREQFSFVCGCARCVDEEAQEARRGSEAEESVVVT